MIIQNKSMVSLSSGGNYILWYDSSDSSYHSQSTNINSGEKFNQGENKRI